MTLLLQENFEVGPDGGTIATADLAFDSKSGGTTGMVYDSAEKFFGSYGAKLKYANTIGYFLKNITTTSGPLYMRAYVRMPAIAPTTFIAFCRFLSATNVNKAQISIDPASGALALRNNATVVATTISSYLGLRVRLEWEVVGSTQTLRVYSGANLHSDTPTETISGAYTQGTINQFQIGYNATPANTQDVIWDSVALDDAVQPGRYIDPSDPDPTPGVSSASVTVGVPYIATGTIDTATIALPTGLVLGDYTFLFCSLVAATGFINPPSGWSEVQTTIHGDASTSSNFALYYKKWASGDPDPVVTCKLGRLVVIPFALHGADPSNPVDAFGINTAIAASSTTISSPSLTSTDGTLVLNMPGARCGTNGKVLTFVPSSGMTELQQGFSAVASVSNSGGMISYKTITKGTSTGVLTATVTGDTTSGAAGMILIVKDPSTAPPGPPPFVGFGVPL